MLAEGLEVNPSTHLAVRFLGKMEEVIKRGLPDGFDDVRLFVKNAISELPWQIDKFKNSVEWMKTQPEWENILFSMKHEYDFDLNQFLDVKLMTMEKLLKGPR